RQKSESGRHVEQHLRTACDLLLDHTVLLRGHSNRACQLLNLFTLEFQNERVTPCWPVIMVMDQEKTNQFGKREYAAGTRNNELVACPVGAWAFYLFYRWHRFVGGGGMVSGFYQLTALVLHVSTEWESRPPWGRLRHVAR